MCRPPIGNERCEQGDVVDQRKHSQIPSACTGRRPALADNALIRWPMARNAAPSSTEEPSGGRTQPRRLCVGAPGAKYGERGGAEAQTVATAMIVLWPRNLPSTTSPAQHRPGEAGATSHARPRRRWRRRAEKGDQRQEQDAEAREAHHDHLEGGCADLADRGAAKEGQRQGQRRQEQRGRHDPAIAHPSRISRSAKTRNTLIGRPPLSAAGHRPRRARGAGPRHPRSAARIRPAGPTSRAWRRWPPAARPRRHRRLAAELPQGSRGRGIRSVTRIPTGRPALARSSAKVPTATRRPWSMIATRSTRPPARSGHGRTTAVAPIAQIRDDGVEALAQLRIEAGRRLVEQQPRGDPSSAWARPRR